MIAPPPDADARLAALEETVATLRQEVAALRAAQSSAAPPISAVASALAHAEPALVASAVSEPRRAEPARRLTPGATRLGAAARAWVTGLGVPEFPADRAGLETLVGRYAAVAVGALVLLMGVGAFLTWAVENFTLAPAARVALGALGAAALATLGERLRRRAGAERFGEVLLALALAVVHVDAWAAGPYLHLVGVGGALGVAAAASAALTALAWRARQQSLFVVGVGGALLAPFVSGAGDAHPLVRPVYGWLVITAGLVALVHGSDVRRPWRGAARLLALGAAAYAAAQVDAGTAVLAANATDRWFLPRLIEHDVAPAFALACAAGPLAVLLWHAWHASTRYAPTRHASTGIAGAESAPAALDLLAAPTPAPASATDGLLVRLALAQLTTAALVLLATAPVTARHKTSLVVYALVVALASQAVAATPAAARGVARDTARVRRVRRSLPALVLAGLVLPLTTLGAALAALPQLGTPSAAGVAALWSALSAAAAAVAWRRSAGGRRDPRLGPHLAAAGLASALVAVVWTDAYDALRLALLGVHAALTAAVFARVPGRTPARDARPLLALTPPLIVLAGATAWGAALLHERAAFAYTPFLTAPSVGAAAVVCGWAVCAAAVWRAGNDLLPRTERAAVVAVAAGVALLWGREELAHAVAPDVATFLLVGYFATAGVGVLAIGRARRVAAARQAGLGLALYAAIKAIVEVSQLDAVLLRVGSYLLVGGFLLGVGYWYRAGTQAAGGTAAVQDAVS